MKLSTYANPLALLLLASTQQVAGWGQLGHRTVALLAERFLLPETKEFTKHILYGESLANAAVWPDYFAHKPEGRYSKGWHYIDAKDDPPTECGVEFERDCKEEEGCVVAAIVNMTEQLTPPNVPNPPDRSLVLPIRFLLHFIGDIHQPLHTENIDRGGNSIPVTYHGKRFNLHSFWDSVIAEHHIGGRSFQDAVGWANSLYNMISVPTGKFAAIETQTKWKGNCFNDDGLFPDAKKARDCAMEWANDANTFVCSQVFAAYPNPRDIKGEELGGKYYENATMVVEELIARAGWRLGVYLNMVVTGTTGIGKIEKNAPVELPELSLWEKVKEKVVENVSFIPGWAVVAL
ncbi:phospholipase C/P1 nuclease [Ascobolus immersus RN42]|uniref:Phospholipase C/P1 nuclease n=1 Tax=Ascobolus immersus RN42 TaxID=1160509 RepID=A0A3N4IN41_ASCIM|nr:phospholipase C/P1 nuclease [Ascobolus immersus RN42]